MLAFYQPKITEGLDFLDEEESAHCIRALRLRKGDEILVLDGMGTTTIAEIINPDASRVSFKKLKMETISSLPYSIRLAISPVKNHDKIEWLIEKCTEIGVDKISFIESSNSERTKVRMDRLQKKAVSALKQSHNPFLPKLEELVSFSRIVANSNEDEKFICYVDKSTDHNLFKVASPAKTYCILIGPEGDFTESELELAIEHGFIKTSLGRNTLRTETAGLYSVSILNLINS